MILASALLRRVRWAFVLVCLAACSSQTSLSHDKLVRSQILSRFDGAIRKGCLLNVEPKYEVYSNMRVTRASRHFFNAENGSVSMSATFLRKSKHDYSPLNIVFVNHTQELIEQGLYQRANLSLDGEMYGALTVGGWLIPESSYHCLTGTYNDSAPVFLVDRVVRK